MFLPGDRVVCITHDTIGRRYVGKYYPKIGVMGTVVTSDYLSSDVKWDEGTLPGSWLIPNINIRLVTKTPSIPQKSFDEEIDNLICSISGKYDV